MNITAIILTYNEEKHLERCIESIKSIAKKIIVVDSYSTDATVEIANKLGAKVKQNKWINYASQFNWAISKLDVDTEWVLRIDADEVLTGELANEIKSKLRNTPSEINGIFFNRKMKFQGRMIENGGVFPVKVLRLFKFGTGSCENRWMDEHIKVSGRTLNYSNSIIDDNLNSISWWIDKHNKYSSREAIDLLNLEYKFLPHDTIADLTNGSEASLKRWVKEVIYAKLPRGGRALAYFTYRYLFRFGFLDGPTGTAYHFLQGYWYRYLVDIKILEVKRYMKINNTTIKNAIYIVLDINLNQIER